MDTFRSKCLRLGHLCSINVEENKIQAGDFWLVRPY